MKRTFAVSVSGIFLFAFCAGTVFAQSSGKAIVDNACSSCHGIKKVNDAKKNDAEWESTLDRMIKKGAKVKPEERAAVLQYLKTLNK
jgi:mono/diheme cytochrome c family protein